MLLGCSKHCLYLCCVKAKTMRNIDMMVSLCGGCGAKRHGVSWVESAPVAVAGHEACLVLSGIFHTFAPWFYVMDELLDEEKNSFCLPR